MDKYSYYLFAQTGPKSLTEATGFFITKGDDLFLVTAAHVLLSWDFKNNKTAENIPKNYYIRLLRKDNNEPFLYELDVSKLRESEKKGFAFEVPDFILVKLNEIKNDYIINTVNEFLGNYPIKDTITGVEVYGFPFDNDINEFEKYISRKPSNLEGILKEEFYRQIYWHQFDRADSINYNIQILKGDCEKGVSGSPVFLTVNDNLIFGGLVCLGDSAAKKLTAVRPEYIIQALREK